MMLQQVKLQQVGTPEGTTVETTCWLPTEAKGKKIKKGVIVRLKKRSGLWQVMSVDSKPTPKTQIKNDWHNDI